VKMVARNPSKALQMGDQYQEMKNTDLVIIKDTILKIASLLVLGFGEAGNTLLQKVLYTKQTSGDFLTKPQTVYAIFGFCDIRNFTDATEVLVDEVLLFVNKIAQIVHSEVSNSEGGANKNIGDAFLVVWKLKGRHESDVHELTRASLKPEDKKRILDKYKHVPEQLLAESFQRCRSESETQSKASLTLQDKANNNNHNSQLAELALIAFLKIQAQLETNPEVQKYNKNEKLLKGIPGFKVSMGFGLHAGWAIEGAIGSHLKIDMSYLSPNVNMSSRLEGLTKIYQVPFLFTSSLFNLFSTKQIMNLSRLVDKIYLSGTTDNYELYTIDIYPKDFESLGQTKDNFSNKFLVSTKNIRFDNITPGMIQNEQSLESSHIQQAILEEVDETQYISYDDIERMWELIIIHPNLVKLLRLNNPQH
jgi:class 3 adenylate cyclase